MWRMKKKKTKKRTTGPYHWRGPSALSRFKQCSFFWWLCHRRSTVETWVFFVCWWSGTWLSCTASFTSLSNYVQQSCVPVFKRVACLFNVQVQQTPDRKLFCAVLAEVCWATLCNNDALCNESSKCSNFIISFYNKSAFCNKTDTICNKLPQRIMSYFPTLCKITKCRKM